MELDTTRMSACIQVKTIEHPILLHTFICQFSDKIELFRHVLSTCKWMYALYQILCIIHSVI